MLKLPEMENKVILHFDIIGLEPAYLLVVTSKLAREFLITQEVFHETQGATRWRSARNP